MKKIYYGRAVYDHKEINAVLNVLKNNSFKKLYILGKKDPVLSVKEALEEAKETQTESVVLSGGHMSHIENTNELLIALQKFVKQC